jgi:hypothetical protein
MKYTNLAGINFEEHVSRMHNVAPIRGYRRYEIYEVYARPSVIKIAIWNSWCDWCEQMNQLGYECGIEISSHNCNFFTIAGNLVYEDEVCDLCITAKHNRLYKHLSI